MGRLDRILHGAYESTHDMRWLERAGETARQFSTWVVSYDFEFPPDSMFGRAGIRTTGSVYANTQNKDRFER